MPKYCFKCECGNEVDKYVSISTKEITCKNCQSLMVRQFPRTGSQRVTETVNSFLNIRHEEDHKETLQKRRTKHFWEVEVPRLVQSGTYSIETCLEEGWLVYNEKGELELGKGPPEKP